VLLSRGYVITGPPRGMRSRSSTLQHLQRGHLMMNPCDEMLYFSTSHAVYSFAGQKLAKLFDGDVLSIGDDYNDPSTPKSPLIKGQKSYSVLHPR